MDERSGRPGDLISFLPHTKAKWDDRLRQGCGQSEVADSALFWRVFQSFLLRQGSKQPGAGRKAHDQDILYSSSLMMFFLSLRFILYIYDKFNSLYCKDPKLDPLACC
jgi:hypothetical protein